jgi:hypothetical protein
MLCQRLSILIGLAIFLVYTPNISVATAQQPPANVSVSLPSDGELDALLSARNWNGLGAALAPLGPPSEFARKLNWLKTRMENGGGLLLPTIYARDRWAIGDNLKVTDPNTDMRVSAALISFYAYEITVIDGAKCEDQSAPSNRVSQLLRNRAATFAFLKQQPPDLKMKVADVAIALERKTAPLRTEDDLICRDGLAQMKASLEKGTQQEVPNTTGHYGKTIAVTPPPDWTPKFVPPSVYRPMQEKARANMHESLLNLVR